MFCMQNRYALLNLNITSMFLLQKYLVSYLVFVYFPPIQGWCSHLLVHLTFWDLLLNCMLVKIFFKNLVSKQRVMVCKCNHNNRAPLQLEGRLELKYFCGRAIVNSSQWSVREVSCDTLRSLSLALTTNCVVTWLLPLNTESDWWALAVYIEFLISHWNKKALRMENQLFYSTLVCFLHNLTIQQNAVVWKFHDRKWNSNFLLYNIESGKYFEVEL